MRHRPPTGFGVTALGLFCGLAFVVLALWGQDDVSRTQPFVVYLEDGPFVTEQMTRDGVTYLPLADLTRRLALPYTDATATQTFTIRAPDGTLSATADDPTILIDGEGVGLVEAPFLEDGRWFAPLELIERGLGAVTGTPFRRTDGAPRMVAGTLTATSLDMEAVQTDGLTRLTIRSGVSVNVRVQQDEDRNQVTLAIDQAPMRPSSEVLDYRDTSIRSVRFDDSDGSSRIVVETTPQLANVRLVPMDDNRTFLVEFIPENALGVASGLDGPGDRRVPLDRVRVIVIDPGHGGLDSGTSAHGTLEKDVTLTLARGLRQILQTELDSTVILTRDRDISLSGETRSAIANSNEADLLISLHIGFSLDSSESGASLFVMKPLPPDVGNATAEDVLFKSWYHAYSDQLDSSRAFAETLEQELSNAIPGLEIPIREAPLSILTSAAMPAVVVEIGNANNADDLSALADPQFRDQWLRALAAAVANFDREGEVF